MLGDLGNMLGKREEGRRINLQVRVCDDSNELLKSTNPFKL